jgi:predicted Zn-ribbon and HTH transcriptional regulator
VPAVKKQLTDYVPLEERDPSTVRAVILSRKSSNGDEEEVKSQVEECQKFIEQRGWKLVADPYQYAEIGKSGRRNVVRKV